MEELLKLNIYYPAAKRSLEEIEILAEMWLEDFRGISADVFIEACSLHRKASQYMPTGKEVLDRCTDVWESRIRNVKKLPEPIPDLTPEQIKENVEKVRAVMRQGSPTGPIIKGGFKNLKEHVKQKLEKYKEGNDEEKS